MPNSPPIGSLSRKTPSFNSADPTMVTPDYRTAYQQLYARPGVQNSRPQPASQPQLGQQQQQQQLLNQQPQVGQTPQQQQQQQQQALQQQQYYSQDQYQQYQQILSGSQSANQAAAPTSNQSYPLYYMLGQGGVPQQMQPTTDPLYNYPRYPTLYVPGYLYQQLGATQLAASGGSGTGSGSGSAGQTTGGAGGGVSSSNPTGANTGGIGAGSGSASATAAGMATHPNHPSATQTTATSLLVQPYSQSFGGPVLSLTSSSTGGALGASSSAAAQSLRTSLTTPVNDLLLGANSLSVGQYQPPGIRPRVTTTMWEDEKTLCYQVDANNVSVVRRADNNMINGTKLLNVAQMTRGRRDGILKLEKVRHVVKIGSMHLKGVWIPFERALAMAQREGIVDLLYPLFVRDIKRVIQTGVTPQSAPTSLLLTAAGGAPSVSTGAQLLLLATSASTAPTLTSLNIGLYYQQYNQPYGALTTSLGAQPGASQLQSQTQPLLQSQQALGQSGGQTRLQTNPLVAQNDPLAAYGYSSAGLAQAQQQQQQQQAQLYGYQQPYYAPNQYYQPYNSAGTVAGGYSLYLQPLYQAYGYVNANGQPPLQPLVGQPQRHLAGVGDSNIDSNGGDMKKEKDA